MAGLCGLVLSIGVFACSGSSGVSSFLGEDDVDIVLNRNIAVHFPEPVNVSSVAADALYVVEAPSAAAMRSKAISFDSAVCSARAPIAAAVSCSTDQDCSVEPSAPLEGETRYALCATSAIAYSVGRLFPGATVYFTTSLLPRVFSIAPPDGASSIGINTTIEVTFNAPMDPKTINAQTIIVVSDAGIVSGTTSLSADGNIATFVPSSNLSSYTTYTVTVSHEIASDLYLALSADSTSSFTTADVIAPSIVAMDPGSGATGQSRATAISAVFSEDMDPTTINTDSFTVTSDGFGDIDGTVSYDAATRTATFQPAQSLFGLTSFTARVSTAATDAHGVPLAQSGSATFTTARAPIVKVSTGSSHTVALAEDGTVWTWGQGTYSQLGNGSTEGSFVPVHVEGLTGITAIDAGKNSVVAALKNDGTVWTWGYGANGQLGDGTTSDRSIPGIVADLEDAIEVSTGCNFVIARKEDGSLVAWGKNTSGQLGDGTTTNHLTPAPVAGISSVTHIAAGCYHALAVTSAGATSVWGANSYGQLGTGAADGDAHPLPILIPAIADASAIASDYYTSYAIIGGEVYAWGYNAYGLLGIGSTDPTSRATPAKIAGLSGITGIATGGYHVTAFTEGTTDAWGWGYNIFGQIGDGTFPTNRTSPTALPGLGTIAEISNGVYFTSILLEDGSIWSIGLNHRGQLGDASVGAYGRTPQQVSGLSDVRAVGQGYNRSYAATGAEGALWAWGSNTNGGLADGTFTDRATPVAVCQPLPVGCAGQLMGIVAIKGSSQYKSHNGLALASDGTLLTWGRNDYGQLGQGTTGGAPQTIPVRVCAPGGCAQGALTTVSAMSIGSGPIFALTDRDANGRLELYGLGPNGYGMLGDGTSTVRSLPVRVVKPTGAPPEITYLDEYVRIVSAAAGFNAGYALDTDGHVWAWGRNANGELGIGTVDEDTHAVPVQVHGPDNAGVLENVDGLYVGGGLFAFAKKSDGSIWAWGYNGYSQLGDGTTTQRSWPVEITALQGAQTIVPGYESAYAIMEDGSVLAWGNNYYGMLGDGTGDARSVPEASPLLDGLSPLITNHRHTLGIKNGLAYEVGFNEYHDIVYSTSPPFADGTYPWRTAPVEVVWPE